MTHAKEILESIGAFTERVKMALANGQSVDVQDRISSYSVPRDGVTDHIPDGSAVYLVVIGPLQPDKHGSDANPYIAK